MAGIIQGVGLGLAIFATLPAIKLINKGQHVKMIAASVVFSVIGLGVIGFAGSNIVMLLPGIILAGVGYVLVVQTTTAWSKGLYPEGNFGQYEGVRIVFNVMIPMVIGPYLGEKACLNSAVEYVNEYGVTQVVPASSMFAYAAVVTACTAIPLIFLAKKGFKAEVQE